MRFFFREGLIRGIEHGFSLIYILLVWKNNNNNYLTELAFFKITIYDLSNRKIHYTVVDDDTNNYVSGFISFDNKYLYACSYYNIFAFNLYDRIQVLNIEMNNSYLFKLIPWSNEIYNQNSEEKEINISKIYNYILVADVDENKNGFYCICISFNREMDNKTNKDKDFKYQLISLYKNGKTIRNIKKIVHPIYGESLLSSGDNEIIDLWINNNKK